ncbi:MAG: IS982 family transposase, partial [Bacteroidales bacterium]|nr:IS982 family transposase [Bacteroidales bacterium]
MKKLHISLVFSNLVVLKPLVTKLTYMRNFTVKFYKILEICKQFAGNRVNEPRLFHLKSFAWTRITAYF